MKIHSIVADFLFAQMIKISFHDDKHVSYNSFGRMSLQLKNITGQIYTIGNLYDWTRAIIDWEQIFEK